MYEIEGFCRTDKGFTKRWISTKEPNVSGALEIAKHFAKLASEQSLDGAVFVRGGGEWIAQYSYGDCPTWLRPHADLDEDE